MLNQPTMSRVHTQSSTAVSYVITNLARGTANVYFLNGSWYRYTNVSRRAILNLECNPRMSLGFWVNHNCIDAKRAQVNSKIDPAYA